MKNLALILLVLLFLCRIEASSQSCLPEGITFTTQLQIDSFPILYPNCTEIEGWVKIQGSDITNLQGVSVVTTMGTYLTIWYNENLTNLSGLDNLTSVGINFTIVGNSSLSDITSLGNLVYVGAALDIIDNPQLIGLSGIENIEAESISSLNISYNPQLTYCEVQSVCDYLANPNGYLIIENNDVGCNSPAEVEEACTVGITELKTESPLSAYPNPFTTSTTIEYELTEPSHVQLTIYNTIGEVVYTAKDSMMPVGKHSFIWTAERLPEGLYYAVLRSEEGMVVVKIIKQ